MDADTATGFTHSAPPTDPPLVTGGPTGDGAATPPPAAASSARWRLSVAGTAAGGESAAAHGTPLPLLPLKGGTAPAAAAAAHAALKLRSAAARSGYGGDTPEHGAASAANRAMTPSMPLGDASVAASAAVALTPSSALGSRSRASSGRCVSSE